MNPTLAMSVAAVVLLTPASVAQDVAAVTALIDKASALSKDGKPEQACLVQRSALHKLAAVTDAAARTRLQKTVDAMLAKSDPCLAKRRKGYTAAARQLIALANRFKVLKYHRVALQLLFEAEQLDAKVTKYPLESLARVAPRLVKKKKKARAAAAAAAAARQSGGRPRAKALVPLDKKRFAKDGWRIESDELSSPALKDTTTRTALSSSHSHEDGTVSVEVRRGAKPGQAAFVFGAESHEDYFIFELQYFSSITAGASLYYWHGNGILKLAHREVQLSKSKQATWLRYSVKIKGNAVTLFVDGQKLTGTCPREAHGLLGVMISGNSANRDPVQFRNLTITPDAEPEAPAEDVISSRIKTAEQHLEKGDKEQAILVLLETQRRLGEMTDKTGRQAKSDRIDELFALAYRHYAILERARTAAATALVEIAGSYTESGWHRSARAVLMDAAAISRGVAQSHLERNLRELKTDR